MSKKHFFSILLISSSLLYSCGSSEMPAEEGTSVEAMDNAVDKNTEELHFKLDMIILNNLTVPISIMEDLKKEEQALYHENYINSLDNVGKYTEPFSQSLNFGVYGMDILYNAAHDHTAEIAAYKDKTLPLATSLGLEKLYNDEDAAQFLAVAGNHAELMDFIVAEYNKVDHFLVEKHEYNTLLLSLTGAIVEGMYFTSMAIEEYGISDLKYALLTNERNILAQLIPLYDHFQGDPKKMELKAELGKIQDDLNAFRSRDEFTEEKAKQLDSDIIALRTKIVNNEL